LTQNAAILLGGRGRFGDSGTICGPLMTQAKYAGQRK
jgi:hypothetical protein